MKYEELKGNVKHGHHYTNTWVTEIQGDSYVVQKILERHGYTVLDEVSWLTFFYLCFLRFQHRRLSNFNESLFEIIRAPV